jgi:hypothetical protein
MLCRLIEYITVAQNTFDILGGVLYIICVFLEAGIFISHLIWMFRTRRIRAQAKEEGKTFDELIEESDESVFKEREVRFGWRKKGKDVVETDLDVEVEAEADADVDVNVEKKGA